MIFWIILVVAFFMLHRARNPKRPLELDIYFGVPGSGKTTYAAYLAREARRESIVIRLCKRFPCRYTRHILNGKHWKRAVPVWSNVPIAGTYKLDAKNDLGVYAIKDGLVILDESGVEFNNRQYKSLPMNVIDEAKYHRHDGLQIAMFSQSHEDMDVTFRRLAQKFYIVKRSLIPFFIVTKLIKRKCEPNEEHQIADQYFFGIPILDTKWIFCPPLWKMFDSYDRKELPDKDWKLWGQEEELAFETPYSNTPIPAPDDSED